MLSRIFNLADNVRIIVLAITVAIVLTLINLEIAGKERILRDGTTVLLRLAPLDPRSLLQGDYMALRYSMADEVARQAEQLEENDGTAIIELDEHNVAKFIGLYNGQQIANGQYLLRYRKRGESVRIASDAFFFEEGSGAGYRGARYGEIRINKDGDAVLVGLRNADAERMGTALHQKP